MQAAFFILKIQLQGKAKQKGLLLMRLRTSGLEILSLRATGIISGSAKVLQHI